MNSHRSILFIANFDDVRNAHAAQQVRALQRLGTRVNTVNLLGKTSLFGRLTGRDLPKRLATAIEEHQPDLVIVIGGDLIEEPLLEALRGPSRARWINWLPDDLRTVVGASQRARPYDHIYAIGTDVAADIHERLARTVDVLSFAADPSIYRPVRTRGQYRANVAFAGSATPRRERLLSGLTEFGLAVWGPGWRSTSLKDYCRGEAPSTEEYIKACGGASVAVNIHHLAVEGGPHEASCNQRVFELAAMGIAQVVDERGDLPRYFEAGKEVAVYHDFNELRDKVRDLLEYPTEAEKLGQAARVRLLNEHTYMHRMKTLLDDQPRRQGERRAAGL